MIDFNTEITCTCCGCNKKFDSSDVIILCAKCENTFIHEDTLKKTMISSITEHNHLWKDKDSYSGFKSAELKSKFMKGVKHGYFMALFWLCSDFNMQKFYEDNLEALERDIK